MSHFAWPFEGALARPSASAQGEAAGEQQAEQGRRHGHDHAPGAAGGSAPISQGEPEPPGHVQRDQDGDERQLPPAQRDRQRQVRADGVTVVMVEQNAFAALDLCDRAYVMEQGVVTLPGTGEALKDNPHVRSAYLGIGAEGGM